MLKSNFIQHLNGHMTNEFFISHYFHVVGHHERLSLR